MINIGSSIVISRPLGQVFNFISSSANDSDWQYGTLASGQSSGGAARLGTAFGTIGHLVGRRNQSTFEVTEYEPDRQYGYKSLSGPLHLRTLWMFAAVDGRTELKVSTQASPTNSLRDQETALEKYMQKQLKEDLKRLKSILEAS
jgi:hypothetical protein